MQTDEKRRYPRFNVSKLDQLRGLLKKAQNKSLVCLGQGGAGFYGTYDEGFQPVRRVDCDFEFEYKGEKRAIEISGYIVYCKVVRLNDNEVCYYGVEFLEAQRDRIKPIVDELHKLAEQGVIGYA